MSEKPAVEGNSTPAPRNIEKLFLLTGLVLVVVYALGTFLPRAQDLDWGFGIEGYRILGPAVFVLLAAALLVLLASRRAAEGLASRLTGSVASLPPAAGIWVVVGGFGLLAWLLPNRTLSGDAGTILYFVATEHIHPSNPLTCYWFQVLNNALGVDPVLAIRLTSTLAGMVYAWAVVQIARECAPRGLIRTGIAAAMLTTGAIAIFFGTIEVYAPVVAAMTLYLFFGIRWLNGHGRGIAPPLTLGIALALHGSALFLAPSLFLLANRGRLQPIDARRQLVWWAIFIAVPLLTIAVLFFGTWHGVPPSSKGDTFGTMLGAENEGPILPLLLSPHEPRQPYAILDLRHILGILNILFRLAPVGIALYLLLPRPWKDARFRFVALAALGPLVLVNLWNVSYALRRDWDLFASLGPPAALLGALAWAGTAPRRASVVRLAALGLFCTIPFVLSNSLDPNARREYRLDLATQLERAVPELLSRVAVDTALVRAREEELDPPGPEIVRGFREQVLAILRETGALDRRWAEIRVPELRNDLHRAIVDRPAPGDGPPDAAVLAGILATDLVHEFERIVEGKPAPGILAELTVRRALDRPEVLQALRVTQEDDADLYLLDVMDDALSQQSGFKLVRSLPGYTTWEPRLAVRLDILANAHDGAFDPATWTVLLGKALVDRQKKDEALEKGWRWALLDETADEWIRRAHTPSELARGAAIERAEWVSKRKDLEPQVRYERVERYAKHALASTPDDAVWLQSLGAATYHLGRRDEAIGYFRAAVRAEPRSLSYRLDLATALRTVGQDEEALEVAERSLRVNPWDRRVPFALRLVGELRLERGDDAVARSVARSVLEVLKRTGYPNGTEGVASWARATLSGATR